MTAPTTARLEDIATINPPLLAKVRPTDPVSFVTMAAVDAETGRTASGELRPYSEVHKGYTPFLNGDLLVAKITPCFENGKIAQAHLPTRVGFGSTEFHVIRPDATKVDARYLLFYLRQDHIRLRGESRMTGSAGQRRVPRQFLASLDIPLPPLEAQRRIAKLLEHVGALEDKRRTALGQLTSLVRSIFLAMFGDPSSNPLSWPVEPMSTYVTSLRGGKSIEATSGDGHAARNRVLKISAVTGMIFRPDQSKPLPDDYSPPPEHFVRTGDLLISRANTSNLVGAVAYVDDTPDNLVLPDKIWRFVWREPGLIEPLFMWALLQTQAVRQELSRRATGTGGSMKNISQRKLLGVTTILPPIEMQRSFSERVREAKTIAQAQTRSLAGLDTLFQSLQDRAFRGEL